MWQPSPPSFALEQVVVVDEKTASASEILSAALQDNGRAKLAGHKTFGKAKVAKILSVSANKPSN